MNIPNSTFLMMLEYELLIANNAFKRKDDKS